MLVLPATNAEAGNAAFNQQMSSEYMERPSPSLLEGSGDASIKGLATSGSQLALIGAKLVEEMSQPANDVYGDTHQQDIKDFEANMVSFQKYLQPDPQTTGFVGNMLYGLTTVAPQAVIGAITGGAMGMAALPAVAQGYSDFRMKESEGVDRATAMKLGVVTGATTALGTIGGGGVFGKTLGTKILTGAGSNVAFGGVNRYATSSILENAGYYDMAQQYKVLDGASIAGDAILGASFGLIHGKVHPEVNELQKTVTPGDTDIALANNSVKQFEEAAPGIPTTPQARNEHFQAMKTATDQILKGEPVNVSEVFKGADYLQRPHDPAITKGLEDAARDVGLTKVLDELQEFRERAAALGIEDLEHPKQPDTAIPPVSSIGTNIGAKNDLIAEPKVKQPESLVSFLTKNGGIQDQGGDILHGMGNKGANPFTPGAGRLLREKGRKLDDALTFAKETGFMPEDADINDLKEKIIEHTRGRPSYRTEEAHLAGRVPDLEEEAFYAGVDTVGKSPEDIRAEIEERKAIAFENGVGEILHDNPYMDIPTDFGDKNAYQAMSDAEIEAQHAENDSKLYEVAVNCALRNIIS